MEHDCKKGCHLHPQKMHFLLFRLFNLNFITQNNVAFRENDVIARIITIIILFLSTTLLGH
jgi:hypothetical protein